MRSSRAASYLFATLLGSAIAFSSMAQTGDGGDIITTGALPDPFDQTGISPITDPIDKAAPGARWIVAGWALNQTYLRGVFLSGTTVGGNFPNCLSVSVPQWTLTITLNGQFFRGVSYNVWQTIGFLSDGTAVCGYSFNAPPTNGYEVLAPGTYVFRMSQPAYGPDSVSTLQVLPACQAPVPMYLTRNNQVTDNFYTTLPSDRDISISTYGYFNVGIPFRVSRSNPSAMPFKRYFKGAPQIEHFYTHLASENQTVLQLGYVYERVEGNVFPTQLTGTLPLYRLAKYNGANGDLQHVYVTNIFDNNAYQAAGWAPDGIKGYVCSP
jgi:hypothetical protein